MKRSLHGRDRVTQTVTVAMAMSAIVALLAVFIFLLWDSMPAIIYNGVGFFTHITWKLGNSYSSKQTMHHGIVGAYGASFGILPFIVGTLASSAIAIVIALPVSIGSALLITEHLPRQLALPFSFLIELLAGIPSVIYGLWGIAVVIPFIANVLGPWLVAIFGFIPIFKGPVSSGQGLLASGLILAIMIIPIITATARDVLNQTPRVTKEGAIALGFTRWEMIRAVSLPWARSGISGAVILGLGRALGETMAVLMVSGNAINYIPHNIYSPIGTMAAMIVSELDAAMMDPTGLAVHVLAEVALVLFVITVLVNIPARIMVTRQLQRGGA